LLLPGGRVLADRRKSRFAEYQREIIGFLKYVMHVNRWRRRREQRPRVGRVWRIRCESVVRVHHSRVTCQHLQGTASSFCTDISVPSWAACLTAFRRRFAVAEIYESRKSIFEDNVGGCVGRSASSGNDPADASSPTLSRSSITSRSAFSDPRRDRRKAG